MSLNLYDLLGRPVSSIFSGRLPEGEHSITTNVAGMIQGVYFYQIVTDRGTSMYKFRILHG
ncbi:MAG: T9SS type A sorting domain-containing protein [Saprospiraceae bacterium]|nr:T9SS type A sorting domain-containing protein [Saprospiraceae bacterium]